LFLGQCSDPYIKRVCKSNRTSKKVYEYLHLVENVRTESGPRKRLILNLGTLDVAPDKFKGLANCIEAILTGQQQLFSADPQIERRADAHMLISVLAYHILHTIEYKLRL